jgi:hypothetical protein
MLALFGICIYQTNKFRPSTIDRTRLLAQESKILKTSDESAWTIVDSQASFSIRDTESRSSIESADLVYIPLDFEEELLSGRVYRRNYRSLVSKLLKREGRRPAPTDCVPLTVGKRGHTIDDSLCQGNVQDLLQPPGPWKALRETRPLPTSMGRRNAVYGDPMSSEIEIRRQEVQRHIHHKDWSVPLTYQDAEGLGNLFGIGRDHPPDSPTRTQVVRTLMIRDFDNSACHVFEPVSRLSLLKYSG